MTRFVCVVLLGFAAGPPLSGQEIKLRTTTRCDDFCVGGLAFSPDGRLVAGGGIEAVKIWDVASGSLTATFDDRKVVNRGSGIILGYSLAFSPDGKILAVGSADPAAPEIRLWDVASGKKTFTLRSRGWPRPLTSPVAPRPYYALAFSPDGAVLAAGGGDETHGEVTLWDSATGNRRGDLPMSQVLACREILCVTFSPDGKLLAVGGNCTLAIYPLAAGGKAADALSRAGAAHRQERILSDGPGDTTRHDFPWVSFSPDGKTLAAAGDTRRTVELWDVVNGKRNATFRGHNGYKVTYAAFLRDGKTVLSVGDQDDDGTIRLWDVASGKNIATVVRPQQVGLRRVALSADGKTLATACGEVFLWDVRDR